MNLTEDELQLAITALAHWRAYLITQGRDDTAVAGLLDKLRSKPAKRPN